MTTPTAQGSILGEQRCGERGSRPRGMQQRQLGKPSPRTLTLALDP